MDMDNKLERTAYHEAGHAVVALVLRLPVTSVTIVPTVGAQVGNMVRYRLGSVTAPGERITYDPNLSSSPLMNRWVSLYDLEGESRSFNEHKILCLYAGPLAEKLFSGVLNDAGAASDYLNVEERASYASLSDEEAEAYKQWLVIRAENILKDLWGEVQAVAAGLLEHKTLTGDDLVGLIEQYLSSGKIEIPPLTETEKTRSLIAT